MRCPPRAATCLCCSMPLPLTRRCCADIRVNSICPGLVCTGILGPDMTDEAFDMVAKDTHLMRRAGRPEEVAKFALFLLSRDAVLMTGSCHMVDGGWSLMK